MFTMFAMTWAAISFAAARPWALSLKYISAERVTHATSACQPKSYFAMAALGWESGAAALGLRNP
jgi:hypothetical protein